MREESDTKKEIDPTNTAIRGVLRKEHQSGTNV